MLDIHFFRTSFTAVKEGIDKKRFTCDLSHIQNLDTKRLDALKAFESARAEQQKANKEISSLDKKSESFQKRLADLKTLSTRVKELENAYKECENEWRLQWLTVPNIPHPSVPVGKTAEDNQVAYTWGDREKISSHACPHYEIPNFEQGIDFSRGSKVMGAGFPFYKGDLAKLVRALVQFFLEEAEQNGYFEVWPPLVVNTESATATGQLPDKEGLMYTVGNAGIDEGYLVPTAEVPVTNFFRNEIFSEAELPKKFCAYTPCFRREAGSWGKDVRGLNRLHQFDKVELVRWELPENGLEALDDLRKDAERILQKLELPYRVLLICSGDMGFPHAKQYDLEVWAGGQKKWLEVSSCSNFTDFQARRANIRYRTKEGQLAFMHTLNGSGLAVPRTLAALLENNIQADGTVRLPSVLHKWLPKGYISFK